MQDPDRPELRPVVRPRRIEPAVVAAAIITVILSVAIWKPWQVRGDAAQDAPVIATPAPGVVARLSGA